MMQVDNAKANELLLAVRQGKRTQDFLDQISGVRNYKLNDLRRQGHIRSNFSRELISGQFLIHLEDVISAFWLGVFEHLNKAKLFGEMVIIKCPGTKEEERQTQNNPVHYLRGHGKMAARNYITNLYRRNLQQGCSNCGHRMAMKVDKLCPRCGTTMSTVYKYVAAETDINAEETNRFVPVVQPQQDKLDDHDMTYKIKNMVDRFAEEVLRGDNEDGTRAYQILKILVDPRASHAMCSACNLCDADSFDKTSCLNYSMSIGEWLGINKSLVASKMRRIRMAFVKWVADQTSDEARVLSEMIPDKFKMCHD